MTCITDVALVYFLDCLLLWLSPIEICSMKSTNWIQGRTENTFLLMYRQHSSCLHNENTDLVHDSTCYNKQIHRANKPLQPDKRTLAFRSQIPPLGLPCCMSRASVVEWKWRHIGVAAFEGLWRGGIWSGISCSRSPYARCGDGLTDLDSVWPRRLTLPLWRDVWRVINAEKRLLVLRNQCASRLHANSCTVMSYDFSRWSTEWVSFHAEAGFTTASGKQGFDLKKHIFWPIPLLHTVDICGHHSWYLIYLCDIYIGNNLI